MDLKLKDKIALVTGGTSDLGREIVSTLVKEGVNVAITDFSDTCEALADTVRGQNVRSVGVRADITKPDQVQSMVAQVERELGPIDILVNCAAFVKAQRFNVSTFEDWEKQVNVCLYGVMNSSRAVINGMIERNYGKIINILGESGRVGEPRLVVTAAARGGVGIFTKALAKEVGRHNINVNGVALGLIRTSSLDVHSNTKWLEENSEKIMQLYAIKRISVPQDIAPTVVYLASDLAGYITGQIVSVSGGYSMI